MEQEEEDICEVVIYADLGRRSRLLTGAGYLRGMHINWRVPLRGLQFRGVISGGYLRYSWLLLLYLQDFSR